jgi:mRNA-degrading endonuclease toxin of MazEF toxin-antitoxin module
VSLRKADLTNFIGSLSRSKVADLDEALKMALDLF